MAVSPAAYGGFLAGKKRPEYRYELFTCAWHGHELAGQQTAEVTPEDAVVVRDVGPQRWCRCQRCDGWFAVPIPDDPSEEQVPRRDQIDLPLRAPALRDRYVLRLLELDRMLHVVTLTFLAIAFIAFATHNRSLHADYQNIMNALNGGGAAALKFRRVLGSLRKAFDYTPAQLFVLAAICIGYACLEAVEAVEAVEDG